MTPRRFTCSNTAKLLMEYVEGTLDGDIREAFDSHLAHCPPCRALMNTYAATIRLTRAISQGTLPEEISTRLRLALTQRTSAQ